MISKEYESLIVARMIDNEDFFECLKEIVKKYELKSGVILCSLGQLKDIELAFYVKEKKQYITKRLSGTFELVSLSGNIAYLDGKFLPHIHAVVSNSELECLGGHLNKAIVNSTIEIFILELDAEFIRKYDEIIGLNLLHFD